MLTAPGPSELTKDKRYGAICYFPFSNIPICILFDDRVTVHHDKFL